MDRTMRTIRSKDRGTHISAHLCSAEQTWSTAPLLLLQRCGASIPSLMPSADCALSAGDAMLTSECSEGMSSGVWLVLQEDVMLGFGCDVWHAAVLCAGVNE